MKVTDQIPDNEKVVAMGECTRPHGLKGDISCLMRNPASANFREGELVGLGPGPQQLQWFKLAKLKKGPKRWVMAFEGVSSQAQAQALVPTLVYLARNQWQAAAPDEFYWEDLKGLLAIDPQTHQSWGRVSGVYETRAQAVLMIERPAGAVVEVPFVKEYVGAVNLDQGSIEVTALADGPADGLDGHDN